MVQLEPIEKGKKNDLGENYRKKYTLNVKSKEINKKKQKLVKYPQHLTRF